MRIVDGYLSDSVLRVFRELNRREIPYMVVGMAGAIMQGATGTTKDIDLWFRSYSSAEVLEAIETAGGVLVWRADPPIISGPGLEVFDVVRVCTGLNSFDIEYAKALSVPLSSNQVNVPVLPLERIIRSKSAANRPKDRAALPMLKDTLKILRREGR